MPVPAGDPAALRAAAGKLEKLHLRLWQKRQDFGNGAADVFAGWRAGRGLSAAHLAYQWLIRGLLAAEWHVSELPPRIRGWADDLERIQSAIRSYNEDVDDLARYYERQETAGLLDAETASRTATVFADRAGKYADRMREYDELGGRYAQAVGKYDPDRVTQSWEEHDDVSADNGAVLREPSRWYG